MATSPKDMAALSQEDIQAIDGLERYVDSILEIRRPNYTGAEVRIVFPGIVSAILLDRRANARLGALIGRYKDAGWGEVDGGIHGDGTGVITLREHKRHYTNHH